MHPKAAGEWGHWAGPRGGLGSEGVDSLPAGEMMMSHSFRGDPGQRG